LDALVATAQISPLVRSETHVSPLPPTSYSKAGTLSSTRWKLVPCSSPISQLALIPLRAFSARRSSTRTSWLVLQPDSQALTFYITARSKADPAAHSLAVGIRFHQSSSRRVHHGPSNTSRRTVTGLLYPRHAVPRCGIIDLKAQLGDGSCVTNTNAERSSAV
jgi:hypothetical protein